MVNDDTDWARRKEPLDQSVTSHNNTHSSIVKQASTGSVQLDTEGNPDQLKATVTGSQVTTAFQSLSKIPNNISPRGRMAMSSLSNQGNQIESQSTTSDSTSQNENVSNVNTMSTTVTPTSVHPRAKSHSSCSTSSGSSGGSGSRGSGTGYPRPVIREESVFESSTTTTVCSNPNDQNQSTSLSTTTPPGQQSTAATSSSQQHQNGQSNTDQSKNQQLKSSTSIQSNSGSNKSGSKKEKKNKSKHDTSSSASSSLNCSTVSIAASSRVPSNLDSPLPDPQQQQAHDGSSHSKTLVSNSTSIISSTSSASRKYSRSHQRRFHRRFPAVDPDEMLIDWFNCALIADILLQGYLYISDNYFAFYSNIFGYKTQLLIPISDVVSISKEKTAKIFPNAVGICTEEAKYTFGSLISRESAYKLLYDTWQAFDFHVNSIPSFDPNIDSLEKSFGDTLKVEQLAIPGSSRRRKRSPKKSRNMNDGDNSNNESIANNSNIETANEESMAGSTAGIRTSTDGSSGGSESNSRVDLDSTASAAGLLISQSTDQNMTQSSRRKRLSNFVTSKIKSGYSKISSPSVWSGENLLLIGTVALVLLFLSTAFLMYRVRKVQSRLEDISGINSVSGSLFDFVDGDGQSSFAQEVKLVSSKLQSKLKEVTELRESLEGLLSMVVELPSDFGQLLDK